MAQFEGYTTKLSGIKNNEKDEPYILLSVEKMIEPSALEGMTMGAVDYFGRKGMDSLLKKFFTPPPKVKRVTKLEDLLPLISFGMVNAILICQDQE